MSQIEELHEQAMDIAEEAFSAQRKGNDLEALRLFQDALDLEVAAATQYPTKRESEPSRSILFRSAAALAFHAKDFEQAEQLVSNGLAGYPPEEIKHELRVLRDDIDFHRHIKLHGTELADQQMQMTLWGNATGHGVILADLLIKRIEQIRIIFYRTIERMSNYPYRISGKTSKEITDFFGLYLDAFLPASFAVTFTIGQPIQQIKLFPENFGLQIQAADVIAEVITCFELIQEESDQLEDRFGDVNYYQNFLALAKQMAPDGEHIKVLGLSALRNGEERTVGLRKTKKEIFPEVHVALESDSAGNGKQNMIILEGVLKVADSLTIKNATGQVKLVDDNGVSHTVRVPIAQMQDIVQPYFDESVRIIGYKKGRLLYLAEISNRADEYNAEMPIRSTNPPAMSTLFDQD